MRVLLDHNVPAYVAAQFEDASTAHREGWHELSNGRLLAAAEVAGFDVLVTRDRGFVSQQNLSGRKIAVAVLNTSSQNRAAIMELARVLRESAHLIQRGSVQVIEISS